MLAVGFRERNVFAQMYLQIEVKRTVCKELANLDEDYRKMLLNLGPEPNSSFKNPNDALVEYALELCLFHYEALLHFGRLYIFLVSNSFMDYCDKVPTIYTYTLVDIM